MTKDDAKAACLNWCEYNIKEIETRYEEVSM